MCTRGSASPLRPPKASPTRAPEGLSAGLDQIPRCGKFILLVHVLIHDFRRGKIIERIYSADICHFYSLDIAKVACLCKYQPRGTVNQKERLEFKLGRRDHISTSNSPKSKCQNSPKVHGSLTENKDEISLPSTCLKPQHVVYCVAALKMEGGLRRSLEQPPL